MKIFFLALSLTANVIALLAISYKNGAAFRVLGEKIRLWELFLITNFLFLIGYISPFKYSATISAPLLYKYKYNITADKTYSVILLDYTTLFVLQLLIVTMFYKFIPDLAAESYLKLAIIIAGIVVISLILLRLAKNLMSMAGNMLLNMKKFISARKFLVKYAASLAVHAFAAPLMLLFILKGLSIDSAYSAAFISYWLGITVGSISGLPGGFGARDVTIGGILILMLGIDIKTSASIIILYRIVATAPHLMAGGYYGLTIGKDVVAIIKERLAKKTPGAKFKDGQEP